MNSLSVLIYFAGVTGSLSGFFGFLCFVFAVLTVITGMIGIFSRPEKNYSDFSIETKTLTKKLAKIFLPAFVVCGIISAFLPSKETVYAIAASEMGEEVIKNPQVQKTINKSFAALDHWLDEQIKPEPEEAAKDEKSDKKE